MAKVTIEMIDDDDGMICCMGGDPIPKDGTQSLAQTIGVMVCAMLRAGIYDDVLGFVAERIPECQPE